MEKIESFLQSAIKPYYYNYYGEHIDDEHYFMYRDDIDDLIKLVVEECAGVAECNGHVSGFSLGDLIRDHFANK